MTGGCTIRQQDFRHHCIQKPPPVALNGALGATPMSTMPTKPTLAPPMADPRRTQSAIAQMPTSWGPSSYRNTHRSAGQHAATRRFRVGKAGGNRCSRALPQVVEGIPGFGFGNFGSFKERLCFEHQAALLLLFWLFSLIVHVHGIVVDLFGVSALVLFSIDFLAPLLTTPPVPECNEEPLL